MSIINLELKSLSIEALVSRIKETSQKYYSGEDSSVTDDQFDEMIDELTLRDSNHPILSEIGWGSTVSDGTRHIYHKIIGIRNVIVGIDNVPKGSYIKTPKLDGGSYVAYYSDGKLVRVLTRGDGTSGQDVTHNSIMIPKISLRSGFTGYVRGEGIVSYENWRYLKDSYSSIRNAAVGIMNSKNPGEVLKYVDFVAYTVYDAKIGNYVPIVELDKYLQVFKRVPYRIGPVALEDYPELVGDYPCDGLVLVSESGTTYKLKFNNDIKDTEVTSISWRTKGTGCIFPRIHYKTIRISDADCSNASGGSYHRLISNGYGPGAKISVVRSGEVIPTVLHAIDPVFTGIVPKCSYGCTTDPVIRGSHVYCSNPDCPAKNESTFQRLIQWKSPKGFTTEMRSFIEDFYVSYDELLKAIRRGELKDISGFTPGTPHQNQMIQETLTSLSNTESISLATLAFICEVNGFGDTIANNVSNYYKGHVHGSVMTPDLDPKVVNNSKASESWKLRYSVISKFLETFIVCEPTEKRLSIETVCISGSLDYGTKKLFDKEVVSRGFTQVGSVDSSCKYLISNELGTSKCKRANSLGIPILTEQEFLKLPIRS